MSDWFICTSLQPSIGKLHLLEDLLPLCLRVCIGFASVAFARALGSAVAMAAVAVAVVCGGGLFCIFLGKCNAARAILFFALARSSPRTAGETELVFPVIRNSKFNR